MLFLGIDPGQTGALALLDTDTGKLVVKDMPVWLLPKSTKGLRKLVDTRALYDLLSDWSADVTYMEEVGGMAGDGAVQAFNFGRAAGIAEACSILAGNQFFSVRPHVWKSRMGLRGGAEGKDECRFRATNLWPANAGDFRLKTRADRAEAALLCEYGRQRHTKGFMS